MISSRHWRHRAQQARSMTDHVRSAGAKVAMMKLAVNYEMLAVRAEQRELARKPSRQKDC